MFPYRLTELMVHPMVVEQDTLQEQVARALAQADATGDFLVAALLSQCLALMHERRARTH